MLFVFVYLYIYTEHNIWLLFIIGAKLSSLSVFLHFVILWLNLLQVRMNMERREMMQERILVMMSMSRKGGRYS